MKINNIEMYFTYNEGKSVVTERFIRTVKSTSDSYAEYNEDSNEKDPKVCDHVRISKWKNIFAKKYIQNWSEEYFVVSKIKGTVPWTYVT